MKRIVLIAALLVTAPGCAHIPAIISTAIDVLEKVEDAARIIRAITSFVAANDPDLAASPAFQQAVANTELALSGVTRAQRAGEGLEEAIDHFEETFDGLEDLAIKATGMPFGAAGSSIPTPLLLERRRAQP